MPFLVSAASAPVKLVNHSAVLKSQQHEKYQTSHSVVDPFDGSNGQLVLPTVRPDFDTIWNGRIVDNTADGSSRDFRYSPNQQEIWPIWFSSNWTDGIV